MVFMGAHNLKNEADLAKPAEDDLGEMESVGSKRGVLDIVVQIHRESGAARYHIKKGSRGRPASLADGEASSGDPLVLENFIAWAKSAYPADHYMLVLWGHAYELAFNREGSDALEFPKLSAVLRKTNNGRKLDIVGFDTCAMSLIEGAYQLRNVANFLVAPQVIDPLPGWPYDDILARIRTDRYGMKPADLGRAIVSRFVRNFQDAGVTMTLLDLSRVNKIGQAVGGIATEVFRAISEDSRELAEVRVMFQRSHVADGQPNIDLTTFCWYLSNYSAYEAVREAARGLGDLMINPQRPFVIEHGRSDFNVAMLNGVSIFAPNVEEDAQLDPTVRLRYEALDFSKQTLWDELVFALADWN